MAYAIVVMVVAFGQIESVHPVFTFATLDDVSPEAVAYVTSARIAHEKEINEKVLAQAGAGPSAPFDPDVYLAKAKQADSLRPNSHFVAYDTDSTLLERVLGTHEPYTVHGLQVEVPAYVSDADKASIGESFYAAANMESRHEILKIVEIAAAAWLVPLLLVFLIGQAIAWVVRGFRKEDIVVNPSRNHWRNSSSGDIRLNDTSALPLGPRRKVNSMGWVSSPLPSRFLVNTARNLAPSISLPVDGSVSRTTQVAASSLRDVPLM